MEMIYSFFQLVKVLGFMNMEYRQLYEKTDISQTVRNTMYKEDTNVLSYYVITLILIYNYQTFLSWCKTNNVELLQFKKTIHSQNSFCDFIEKKYKSPRMLKAINCSNEFFKKIKNKKGQIKKEHESNSAFLTNNLRMTICELG
jgi:hypothetical protein